AHHPVEPPELIVAIGVRGRYRVALIVVRRGPAKPFASRAGERVHRPAKTFSRQSLRLSRPGSEPCPPQEPLRLGGAEPAVVDGRPGRPRSPVPSVTPAGHEFGFVAPSFTSKLFG